MKTLEIGQLELGQEVRITTKLGDEKVFEGKVIDFSRMQTQIWIENEVDIYRFNMHHVEVVLVEQEEERAPEGIKDLSTIKAEYKEELAELWSAEVGYHTVKVYNSDEDGAEVYDCEFTAYDEDSAYLFCIAFGTFYNEKDALAYARTMRTKLKRTFDIEDKVTVYSC